MSQLWLTLAYLTYDSFAVAVFSERLTEYLKDKGIEVTYLIGWCDAPKQETGTSLSSLAEDAWRCQFGR